jgi:hypothetical protein
MKTLLTIVVTAAVCFGITAAAGLARTSAGRQYTLEVGDRSVFKPGNLQCQALAKSQVVCGGLKVTNSVAVYYSPTQLAVVRVSSQQKGTLLYQVKR